MWKLYTAQRCTTSDMRVLQANLLNYLSHALANNIKEKLYFKLAWWANV